MSLLNGLLYLMLLLAGLSTVLIMADLKKREDQAYAKLEALYAIQQDVRPSQHRFSGPRTVTVCKSQQQTVRRVSDIQPVRLSSFFDIDDRSDLSQLNQGTAPVNYDFSVKNKPRVHNRTVDAYTAFDSDTSCCA